MRHGLVALAWLACGLAAIIAGSALAVHAWDFGPELFVAAVMVGVIVFALGCWAASVGIKLGYARLRRIAPEVDL